MSAPIFPNEPIRVDAGEHVTPREHTPEEREDDAVWDEFDSDLDGEGNHCTWCGGDGTQECDGSGADDGEDTCVRAHPHPHRCGACYGSGLAKDQWIW